VRLPNWNLAIEAIDEGSQSGRQWLRDELIRMVPFAPTNLNRGLTGKHALTSWALLFPCARWLFLSFFLLELV
jgi:hypothetical protein